MMTFCCEHCTATFSEKCDDDGGNCGEHHEHLAAAGWKPVWIKVSLQSPPAKRAEHVFSKGGFLCPACVTKFSVRRNRKPKRRPARCVERTRFPARRRAAQTVQ